MSVFQNGLGWLCPVRSALMLKYSKITVWGIFAIILHCLQLILSLTLGGKSSKSASATTSPIKDTIRGSQEMIKKLMSSKDRSGLSSSSSEKVCIFGHFWISFFENLVFLLLACYFGSFLAIFDFLEILKGQSWQTVFFRELIYHFIRLYLVPLPP